MHSLFSSAHFVGTTANDPFRRGVQQLEKRKSSSTGELLREMTLAGLTDMISSVVMIIRDKWPCWPPMLLTPLSTMGLFRPVECIIFVT
jgi:hypothetical protein